MVDAPGYDQRANSTPYAPLIAPAMRAILPLLEPELVKFFAIAVTHRDALNLLFPGTEAWRKYGYHAALMASLYEQCCALGLMRKVAERGKDRFGRLTPDVYQLNPALIYIDPSRYVEAMSVSDVPFCALPSQPPDQRFPSPLDQAGKSSSLKPDHGFPSPLDQAVTEAESEKQNQDRRINKKNQEEESAKQNQNTASSKVETHFSPGGTLPVPDAYRSNGSNPGTAAYHDSVTGRSKTRTQNNPTTPLNPPASPRKLDPYRVPMAQRRDELIATLFTKTARNTKIEYARMYVAQFGADVINQALIRYADEVRAGESHTNPTGIIVTYAKAISGGRTETTRELYDIGNAFDCQLAAFDPALPAEERATYLSAFRSIHGERDALITPRIVEEENPKPESPLDRIIQRHESDDEIAARMAQLVEQHRAQKGLR